MKPHMRFWVAITMIVAYLLSIGLYHEWQENQIDIITSPIGMFTLVWSTLGISILAVNVIEGNIKLEHVLAGGPFAWIIAIIMRSGDIIIWLLNKFNTIYNNFHEWLIKKGWI